MGAVTMRVDIIIKKPYGDKSNCEAHNYTNYIVIERMKLANK